MAIGSGVSESLRSMEGAFFREEAACFDFFVAGGGEVVFSVSAAVRHGNSGVSGYSEMPCINGKIN